MRMYANKIDVLTYIVCLLTNLFTSYASVLMIDCKRDLVSLVGGDYGVQSAKWGTPVIVPLGNYEEIRKKHISPSSLPLSSLVIVFPPLNASRILLLDPRTKKTSLSGEDLGNTLFKYDGACLGSDGAVYCAPSCAPRFLRIEVTAALKVSTDESGNGGGDDQYEDGVHDPVWKSSLNRMKSDDSFTERDVILQRKSSSTTVSKAMQKVVAAVHVVAATTTSRSSSGSSSMLPKPPLRMRSKNAGTSLTSKTTSGSSSSQSLNAELSAGSLDVADGFERSLEATPSSSTSAPSSVLQDSAHTSSISKSANKSAKSTLLSRSLSPPPTPQPRIVTSVETYVWPPEVSVTHHGVERAGNFKFGGMVMSADGKTAISVPMNVSLKENIHLICTFKYFYIHTFF
jgi:hypothetical protein